MKFYSPDLVIHISYEISLVVVSHRNQKSKINKQNHSRVNGSVPKILYQLIRWHESIHLRVLGHYSQLSCIWLRLVASCFLWLASCTKTKHDWIILQEIYELYEMLSNFNCFVWANELIKYIANTSIDKIHWNCCVSKMYDGVFDFTTDAQFEPIHNKNIVDWLKLEQRRRNYSNISNLVHCKYIVIVD